jgi:hypothetical protein
MNIAAKEGRNPQSTNVVGRRVPQYSVRGTIYPYESLPEWYTEEIQETRFNECIDPL